MNIAASLPNTSICKFVPVWLFIQNMVPDHWECFILVLKIRGDLTPKIVNYFKSLQIKLLTFFKRPGWYGAIGKLRVLGKKLMRDLLQFLSSFKNYSSMSLAFSMSVIPFCSLSIFHR